MRSFLAELQHFGPTWPQQAADGPTGAELRPWARGMSVVRLWGRFPPGWAGALSLGLAHEGVGIVRGFARQVGIGRWVAELQVQPAAAATELSRLDFLGLAQAPHGREIVPLRLRSWYVDSSPETGGALYLEVRGEDRLGFLGSLLARLAALSLFPAEMMIETQDGLALDRFALRGVGGRLPSDDARQALVAMLAGLTAGRAAVGRLTAQ